MNDVHPAKSRNTNLQNSRQSSTEVDSFLEQYASTIRAQQVPADTRARLQKVFAEQKTASAAQNRSIETGSTTAGAPGTFSALRRPRRTVRCAVAAASTAILILAGAAAITLGDNSSQSNNPLATSVGQQEDNSASDIPVFPKGNFFMLKAWADETTEANVPVTSTDPLGINWLHPAFVSSWEAWQDDPVFGKLLEPGEALTYFNFDAQCEGANLVSVSYRIDNKNAFFEYFDWKEVDKLKETGEDPQQSVEYGPSFTLTYGEGGTAETAHTRLYVISSCPAEYDESPHAIEGYAEAARILNGSVITLSATFDDGSTQEQAYRIAMVDDFNEKCQEFLDQYFAAWDTAGPQGEEAIPDEASGAPKLFTLERIGE